MKEIILFNSLKTKVDNDMFPMLNKIRWNSNFRNNSHYPDYSIWVNGKSRHSFLHWYVIGHPLNGLMVDHINGDTLDNRRKNLRIVTRRENGQNRKSHRNGKLVGASLDKTWGGWKSCIKLDGKLKWLGRFKTELQAHMAYKATIESHRKARET